MQTSKIKIFILLVTGYWLLVTASAYALKIGDIPPDFSLPGLKGETISLSDYLSKEVVILSFFASWSKPCQEEIKFLNGLQEEYKENLKIIGISFDRKTKDLTSFIKNNKIELEIAHDKKLSTLDDFQILIIPTLILINPDGTLRNVYIDFDENVKKAITKETQELLNPPSPEASS